MWWAMGVVCVVAMGVAISEYLAVRQVENRIRRKWRDHERQKNQAKRLVHEREKKRLSTTDADSKKVD